MKEGRQACEDHPAQRRALWKASKARLIKIIVTCTFADMLWRLHYRWQRRCSRPSASCWRSRGRQTCWRCAICWPRPPARWPMSSAATRRRPRATLEPPTRPPPSTAFSCPNSPACRTVRHPGLPPSPVSCITAQCTVHRCHSAYCGKQGTLFPVHLTNADGPNLQSP